MTVKIYFTYIFTQYFLILTLCFVPAWTHQFVTFQANTRMVVRWEIPLFYLLEVVIIFTQFITFRSCIQNVGLMLMHHFSQLRIIIEANEAEASGPQK